ncbi:dipeptidase [Rouxiella badensis]|uniref:dipeptidase n=1 Tax=Rouxiella badensis TaxID=1646377 RepID=UPI001D159A5E|nr:dipeptidase [Rouxiella badensis]MCC3731633.1 dipeptidase [Rouxiella badensis]MCC3757022.1 dipeptidase [Rouxiella badensis]
MNNIVSATEGPVPVFDGHNDVLLQLWLNHRQNPQHAFLEGPACGQMDLARCREAGFAGGLFAAYVPSPKLPDLTEEASIVPGSGIDTRFLLEGTNKHPDFSPTPDFNSARDVTIGMMAFLLRIEKASAGAVKICRSAKEIRESIQNQSLAVVMHIEGAEAIDPDLYLLDVFYAMGLRSIGPVWSRPNIFGHGVPFKFPSSPDLGPGLTELGIKLVKACNQKRIMVDLSHLDEKGFWQVAKHSDAPLVASHSNAHALSAQSRNLTDKQLEAIKESGGFVGVNFGMSFLREDGQKSPDASVLDMVRHVDYLVEKLGEDKVGFGSDFDGVTLTPDMVDVRGLRKFEAALRKAGYNTSLLEKICHKNWIGVLERTWGE